MHHALRDDMDKAIEEHSSFNKMKANSTLTASKKRAGNIVRDMLAKRLFAYFKHWYGHTRGFDNTMNMKVKDKIIKLYKDYLRTYLNHWRKNASLKTIKKKKKMISTMMSEQSELENESFDATKNLREKSQQVNR